VTGVSSPAGAPESSRFGESVAIDPSGGFAVVGAPGETDPASPGLTGAAYLVDAATGEVIRRFIPDSSLARVRFGDAVAIEGGLVAVGASEDNDAPFSDIGSVFVFDRVTGAQLTRVVMAGPGETSPEFGRTVALDGGRVLSRDRDDVFVHDATTGALLRRIELNERDITDDGLMAASDGRVLVASGVIFQNGLENGHQGAVYDIGTGALVSDLRADRSILDEPAGRVSIDFKGGIAVIGIPYDTREFGDPPPQVAPGAVYVFDAETGEQIDRIRYAGTETAGAFGEQVATDGVRVIASGRRTDPVGAADAPVFDIATGRFLGEVPLAQNLPVGGLALVGETVLVGQPDAAPDDLATGRVLRVDLTGPCGRADLAAPWSVLDLADLVAFVSAFQMHDIAADLERPWGVCDLTDLVAFVERF
jgi:outer membrane protein assembly factor BamB